MSITITDPQLLARWAALGGLIELTDSVWNPVGRLQTAWPEPFPGEGLFFSIDRVSDHDLLLALARVKEPVEVFDSHGRLVGRFEQSYGYKPPFSDEDIERCRRDRRGGRSLAEVWKFIFEKYVGDEVEPFIVDGGEAVA